MSSHAGQSAGGRATAIKLRAEALERYWRNPVICRQCQEPIAPREGQQPAQTRKKRYCSHACAAKYYNVKLVRTPPEEYWFRGSPPVPRTCSDCSREFVGKKRKRCPSCHELARTLILRRTRGETNRMVISRHARSVLLQARPEKHCERCEYSLHVQACHRRSVASFALTATIAEVNALDNLVWLCPNHHWELDNGHLSI